jgi:hypothetical protein
VSQHEAAAERLGCQPRRSQWPTTSIPGLIERTANGGQPDHPARSRRRPPVSRSARSWAGADLPIEARSGQPHHSATAKQYCPSSSFRARHLRKRAIAASYGRLYALAGMRGYPRRAARQHISKILRPPACTVEDSQDLDGVANQTVRHDVRRPRDHELARPRNPTRPPHSGLLGSNVSTLRMIWSATRCAAAGSSCEI